MLTLQTTSKLVNTETGQVIWQYNQDTDMKKVEEGKLIAYVPNGNPPRGEWLKSQPATEACHNAG